jgi:hypothetical protein
MHVGRFFELKCSKIERNRVNKIVQCSCTSSCILYVVPYSTPNLMANTAEVPARREVAESAFEYLLGEIIARETSPLFMNASASAAEQRLELLGYNVGYRYLPTSITSMRLNRLTVMHC